MALRDLSAPNRSIWQPLSYSEPTSMNVGRLNYLPTIENINKNFEKNEEAKTAFDFLTKSIKAIDEDNPIVKEYINKTYKIDPTDVTDPFAHAKIRAKAQQFASELNDPNSLIGNAQYNYFARQKANEDLNKLVGVGEGKVDSETANQIKKQWDEDYTSRGGLGQLNENQTYNKFQAPSTATFFDGVKLVNDTLKDWKSSSGEHAYAEARPDGNGYIVKVRGKDGAREVTSTELESIRPLISKNPQFAAWYNQEARLKTKNADPNRFRDEVLAKLNFDIATTEGNKNLSKSEKEKELEDLYKSREFYKNADEDRLRHHLKSNYYDSKVNEFMNFAIDKGAFSETTQDRFKDLEETAYLKASASGKAKVDQMNIVNSIPTEAIDVGIESPIKGIEVKGNDVIEKPKPKLEDFYNEADDAWAMAKSGDVDGRIAERARKGKEQYNQAMKEYAYSTDKDANRRTLTKLFDQVGLDPNLSFEARANIYNAEYAKNKERHLDAALSGRRANEEMSKLMFKQTPAERLKFKVGNQGFGSIDEFADYLEEQERIIPTEVLEKGKASVRQWILNNAEVNGTILGGHSGFDGAAVSANIGGKGFYVSGNNELNSALRPLGQLQRQILDPAKSGEVITVKDKQGAPDYFITKFFQNGNGLDYTILRTDKNGKPIQNVGKQALVELMKGQLKNYNATPLVNAMESGTSKVENELNK